MSNAKDSITPAQARKRLQQMLEEKAERLKRIIDPLKFNGKSAHSAAQGIVEARPRAITKKRPTRG